MKKRNITKAQVNVGCMFRPRPKYTEKLNSLNIILFYF